MRAQQSSGKAAVRGHVSARKVLLVVGLAERAGLMREALLRELGLDPAVGADPEAWVPQEAWRRVWEIVVAHTGDEALGIRAAAGVDPGYFGVIDYAARSAADLREAVPLAARYFRLANSWGRLELRPVGEGIRVSRHLLGDELGWLPPQAADFALATMVRVMRLATARPFSLTSVQMRRPAPADAAPWRQTFGVPVSFDAAEDAIEIGPEALATPMRAPDARLRALIEGYAEGLLRSLEAPDAPLPVRARHQIAVSLAARRGAELESVARGLGLSGRTLQRRLQDEGSSFRALLDEVRRAMARRWLAAGLSPGEVTFLLGYSEVSAFGRAFHEWEGCSPAAWARVSARAGAQGPADGALGQGGVGGSDL